MADNDLALGRIMQFLSLTPYWKDMLVIVTEDDPQGGVNLFISSTLCFLVYFVFY